jgi:WD40 repeat protein
MLNLWRVSDGTLLRSINAHTTAVYSVALSPDASLVISGGGVENQLKIWRTADGALVRSVDGSSWGPFEGTSGMVSVAFSPDGRYVAGSALEVWKVDGTAVRVGPSAGEVDARTHVTFTPDSARVFATHTYGIIGYVIADGTAIEPRSLPTSPPFAISPDGRSLISTSPNVGGTIPGFIWAVLTDRDWALEPNQSEIDSFLCADSECPPIFSSLAFDPRMRTVAAGALSGEVLLLELPIWISGIQRNGNQVNLQWQGGSGNYQLQKLRPPDTWENVGDPVTSNAASVSIDSSSALLRIRNVAP